MSTKNIEAVLMWVTRGDAPKELTAAWGELEAIQKACAMLHLHGVVHNMNGEEHETTKELDAAANLLMRIGDEESP